MVDAERNKEPIWSVTEVNAAVRELVEGSLMPFWVTGEVSSLLIHRSGHVYMTLKDADSQLRACWFSSARQCRELEVANGSKIEAYGRLTVYPARGEYQFTIRSLRIAGQGDLFRRFEELKKKLEAEGLFAPERKRPIPKLPKIIGVVTSPSGAAIRDFLKIIDRRFPKAHIRICPCQVQGAGAAAEIAAAVNFLSSSRSADVIVVTRGGGSMEDLWAFNEEPVARAVAASQIPVISAVGHEIDFTICDFAADLRVPTPSAAAELVISGYEELSNELDRLVGELRRAPGLYLATKRGELERFAASPLFRNPKQLLELPKQRLDEAEMRLVAAAKLYVTDLRARLERSELALRADDPRRQLERGFALVRDAASGTLVRSKDVEPGTRLDIQVADGSIPATVLHSLDELF
jgi:exodeoxyribonuclease VII large subunit